MNHLIFDIETVRNEECGWEPPPDDPKRFPPIPAHRIVAIGGMILGFHSGAHLAAELRTFGEGESPTEREIIDDFMRVWRRDHASLVSFNGRNFDVPVIIARMMRLGMISGTLQGYDFSKRYQNTKHVDLVDIISNFGAAPRAKLDEWCRLIGLPGKLDVDGSDVQRLYNDGKLSTIKSYVQCDIIQTALLYLRWRHNCGELPQDRCNDMIKAVIDLAHERDEPLISKLLDRINMGILLLPPRSPEEIRADDEQEELPF